MNTNDLDIGHDLELTKQERRTMGGGTWVDGSLHGHRFQALVFAEHAECPDYEIDDSRISKLWIKRLDDDRTVFNWDRGMDIPAADETTQAIVGFLAAGLADHVYG